MSFIWLRENYGLFTTAMKELQPYFYIETKLAGIYNVLLHVEGSAPSHIQYFYTLHSEEQPSPEMLLLSSHD